MSAIVEQTPAHKLFTGAAFSSLPVTLTDGKAPLLAPIGRTTTSPWLAITAEQLPL